MHNDIVNDASASTGGDGRTASRVFSDLWSDQSRRTWLGAALLPGLVAAVVTLLYLAMQADRLGVGITADTVRSLTVDAIDASRIYVPVATGALTVWITLVAFTALAGADSAERTAILLRLRAVVQMTFAVGWSTATALAVLIAVARTDAWPVIGMVTVMVLLTAVFATLSALYLVVGNAGMRREQLQRMVADEKARRDDLRRESEHRPLWTRIVAWALVIAVCDVMVALIAFTPTLRVESQLLRVVVLALFQMGYATALAYDAYLAIRLPSSSGWFPRTGQRALTYVAMPIAGVILACQLTEGWRIVVVAAAAIIVPVVAVLWPQRGIARGLSRLAARGLDASVHRYSLHLRNLEAAE